MSLFWSGVSKLFSGMENKFHIVCDVEDIRLDVFLSEKLSTTRTKIKDMIESGCVRVAGRVPKPSLKIKRFMKIEGEMQEDEPLTLAPQDIPLRILYEDDCFLAVDKPKDMVVHPSFGHREGTLVNAVLGYLGNPNFEFRNSNFEIESLQSNSKSTTSGTHQTNSVLQSGFVRPGIVHRLDKGTTGVIIVAKDSKTQETLSALFKKRTVQKTYRTITEGIIEKNEGTIEGNIGRHPKERKKMAVLREKGRDAVTSFRVIKRLKGFTYIEVYPRTGRTHQIRVHLAHIGHPVAGDDLYGRKAKHVADRPLLHAYKIEFVHPGKNIPLLIEAPVPGDMEEFIKEHS